MSSGRWFALCILRIVVKLAVIKDIPAISLLGFVLQFSFFRERNLPLGSEMPNERCHPGRILEASLACFIAQPECDLLTSGAYAGSKCLGCVIS